MSRRFIFGLVCFSGGLVGYIVTTAGYGIDTIQYWMSIGCVTGAYILGREYESRQ